MPYKIFIPRDSSAISLGADKVYQEILNESKNRNIDIDIVANFFNFATSLPV